MNEGRAYFQSIFQRIAETGIWVDRRKKGLPPDLLGNDYVLAHYYVLLIHQGTLHVRYDLLEATLQPNEMVFILPGHVIRFVEPSEDFVFTIAVIAPALLDEMRFHAFSHDMERFHYHPLCRLTDEQMERVMSHANIFTAIIGHSHLDLPLRRSMLLAQMAVAYEFINYYRREQDKQWTGNKNASVFARFRDLVVVHLLLEMSTRHSCGAPYSLHGQKEGTYQKV